MWRLRAYSITSSARVSTVARALEAERLGGLEVNDPLVLGRRLHRQVGWSLALEDAIDVGAGLRVSSTKSGPYETNPPAATKKRSI
jgi:hypothetical protein